MDAALKSDTERWFVRQGLPHAIDDYSAAEDVFTRAAPFLAAVFFLEVFASFDDRFNGWQQLGAFVAGVAIMVAAVALVNRFRGRRALALPNDVGVVELALFVFVPAILPALFSNDRGWRFLALVGFNIAVVALTYVVTSYGLLPMLRFGADQVFSRLSQIGQLVARSLPMLLLLTAFIFLNAEMWQVASDFPPSYYAIVVAFLVLAGAGFLAMRAPREVANLEQFSAWSDVMALASCTDAPIARASPRSQGSVPEIELLGRTDRANVAMLVVMSQLVQVLLVAVVIGLFYVAFGLLAVRASTIEQWTTAELNPLTTFDFLGSTIVVTWEHLAVAGFIAAFSSLQFAVSMVTDSAYRDEFYEDVTGKIRQTLAVRALYLDQLETSD